MGQTCCGPRSSNSKVVRALTNSQKFKNGEVDADTAEIIWAIYAGDKKKEKISFAEMEAQSVQIDILTAQKKLIKKRLGENATGYGDVSDSALVKEMKQEPDEKKKRARQLLDGVDVNIHNDGNRDFVIKLFGGYKDKKNQIVNDTLTKKDFIDRYCESVKSGIKAAAGN